MRLSWRDDVPVTNNPLRFFLSISKGYWVSATLAIFCVIAAASLNAIMPYLYKVIADSTLHLAEGYYMPLVLGIAMYLVVSTVSHLFWRGSGFAGAAWSTGVRATARYFLMSHLTLHSHQYFSDRFSGSLLSKVKQAGDGVREFASMFLWEVLRFVVSVVVSFIVVFSTNMYIGFILLALFVINLPIVFYFTYKRIPLSIAAQNAETKLNGVTVDTISNISSVQEYAKRGFEMNILKSLIAKRQQIGMRNWHYGEWILLVNGLIINLFMGLMIGAAIYLAIQGIITPGDIILFLTVIWLLEEQFLSVGSKFNQLTELWGQLKESLSEILEVHEVANTKDAKELTVTEGSLSFNNVTFLYGGYSVFDDLSFTLTPGQRVGLIGKSGAGKSTLIKLILRHYDVHGGSIEIDGTDIRSVTKESLRNSIAVVPQEPSLFHRTIHENIAYARPDATREEVIRAATLAQAHEFIMQLEEGYDSLVGERGIKLSGGQRQRIAIARALLKDAPFILLDEATSALDSESEVAVQKALLNLMEGRTVIAIAHRLSTLRAMDRLMIFEKGKIVQDGSHDELVTKEGLYKDLWNHQAGGFIDEDDK